MRALHPVILGNIVYILMPVTSADPIAEAKKSGPFTCLLYQGKTFFFYHNRNQRTWQFYSTVSKAQ